MSHRAIMTKPGVVLLILFVTTVPSLSRALDPHGSQTCATYGICGHRADGDVLSCAETLRSPALNATGLQKLQQVCPQLAADRGIDPHFCCTEEQLDTIQRQIQVANIFLVGCPACSQNFKQLFCLLSCHPDQATFTNVTVTQPAADTNASSVANVTYFVAPEFGRALFDSCKDVTYPVLNQKAMKFVGGGATSYQEWLDFIGTIKDARFPPTGSPFQMDFPPIEDLPEAMTALNSSLASCCEGPLACSCGDCPHAKGCTPPPAPPELEQAHCGFIGGVQCGDLGWVALAVVVLVLVPPGVRRRCREEAESAISELDGLKPDTLGPAPLDGRLLDYPGPEALLRRAFYAMGELCGLYPWRVIAFGALGVLVLTAGMVQLHVETDPEALWVGPGSQAAREKSAYEASFGPFYRIAQLILSTDDGLAITTDANLRLLFDLHEAIGNLTAKVPIDAMASTLTDQNLNTNTTISLDDVCFKPLDNDCAIESVAQYWQLDREVFERGAPPTMTPVSADFCYSHWNTQCLSACGAPIDPHVVLGGFPQDSESFRNFSADATAFVVTFLLNAPRKEDKGALERALAWEKAFLQLAEGPLTDMVLNQNTRTNQLDLMILDGTPTTNLRLSFSAERSVADELKREGWADAGTVAASYIAMLVYIGLAMSSFPKTHPLFLHTRLGVGLAGVLIVAGAVTSSLGLFGWAHLPASLIIMEVIPFLALAIGVDNMFILAAGLDAHVPGQDQASDAARAALALAGVGPSILLAAACEASAFALGSLTSMLALRSFSLCAAAAVALDFLLQVTVFVAVLVLDARRVHGGQADLFFWIRLRPAQPLLESEASEEAQTHLLSSPRAGGQMLGLFNDDDDAVLSSLDTERQLLTQSAPGFSLETVEEEAADDRGTRGLTPWLRTAIRTRWAPFLGRPTVKIVVVSIFSLLLCLSLALIPRLERGLEQATALPADSYLQGYFHDVAQLLRVGPPLYFVVHDLPIDKQASIDHICSIAGCDTDSFLNDIAAASQAPWDSRIATPAASWIDDFMTWVNPEAPLCCRLRTIQGNGTSIDRQSMSTDTPYCPPPDQEPCASDPDSCADCVPCLTPEDLPSGQRPTLDHFQSFLPVFLRAKPSQACAKGGKGGYDGAVEYDQDGGTVKGLDKGQVAASAFRTSYSPLSIQDDFVGAISASRELTERESDKLGLECYAYSVFHVFFEQYLTIGGEAVTMIAIAAAAVFILSLAMTGSAISASIILLVLLSLVVDIAGFMVVAGIQFNAISVVNLVASLGIGVEFCAHLLHAFLEENGSREARTQAALAHVGAPILSGITLTKIVGVSVLALARTAIFRVYFFRMYAALVALGALHGLVLLPVLLSLLGPDAWERWGVALPSRPGSALGSSLPSDILREIVTESEAADERKSGKQPVMGDDHEGALGHSP